MDRLKLCFVTFGFLGCSPKAPGTVGTLGGVLVAWFHRNSPSFGLWMALWVVGLYAGGRALGGWAERRSGGKDPQFFVVDEVIGYLITIAWTRGPSPLALLLAFCAFRFFDIAKPWLVRRLERLPGADGILLDDVMAGVYAWALVMLPARLLIPVNWGVTG